MNIIFILIPLSLVLVGVAIWAFFWAVNAGQFDDLDTPGWEMLAEPATDQPPAPEVAPPAIEHDARSQH